MSNNPCQAWNPAVRGAVFDAESDPSKITEILVVVVVSQPFLVIRKTPGAKKKHPITGCASERQTAWPPACDRGCCEPSFIETPHLDCLETRRSEDTRDK